MKNILLLLFILVGSSYAADAIIGKGCTTAHHIDHDCDGYGISSSDDAFPLLGWDADDEDPTVNTVASWRTKYGSGPGDTSNATLLAFLLASRGYAPTNLWFLSTTGNDSTCVANDITKPCLTFNKAYTSHTAGGMVVVRGGTFQENNNYSAGGKLGTALSPDYIMGYPGEQAIFDHTVVGWYGITQDLGATPYLTVDNMKVTNTPCIGTQSACGFLVNIAGDGDTIRNCELSNGFDGIVSIGGVQNEVIENNVIYDDTGSGQNEHDIYVGANANPVPTTMTGLIVRGNILYNANRDNFHSNGDQQGATIEGNILYSSNMVGGGAPNMQLQDGFHSGIVQNNIVMCGSASAIAMDEYYDATPILNNPSNNNLFANNTIFYTGISNGGIDQSLSGFSAFLVSDRCGPACTTPYPNMGSNTYLNNIMVQAATGSFSCGQSCAAVVRYDLYDAASPNWLTTDTWENNIIFSTAATSGAPPLSYGYSETATSHLTVNINSVVTSFTVTTGTGSLFAVSEGIVMGIEFMVITGISGDTLTVNRGVSSTPTAHSSGDIIYTINTIDSTWTRNWAQFGSLAAVFTNNINTDPLVTATNNSWYTSPGLFNYSVTLGSPAILAGLHAGAPTTDIRGLPRANPPTIGAYEFQSSSPTGGKVGDGKIRGGSIRR